MNTPNKQHDKSLNGVNPTSVQRKQRPGTSPDQDANADYDYRPDFGESGGADEHNPELKKDSIQKPAPKSGDKSKRGS